MGRSQQPSVWIQAFKTKRGFKKFRVRRTVGGRELPSIACGGAPAPPARGPAGAKTPGRGRRVDHAPRPAAPRGGGAKWDLTERGIHQAVSTVVNDERAIALFTEYAGGEIRLDAVDKDLIRGFIHWMLKKEYSRAPGPKAKRYKYQPNGVRILLRSLKTFFRAALADEKIPRDPFFKVALPPEIDVAHPPTDEELAAMWAHVPPLGQLALTVDAALGLRRGEVLAIDAAALTPPARAGAPWGVKIRKSQTPRGRGGHKVLAVPPAAMAALEELRPWPTEGPIFKLGQSTLSSWVKKAARKAGLGRIRLHDFRHRWATELMSAAKDEYALMQVGGWTSRAAVSRYQHGTEARRDVTLAVKSWVPTPTLHTDAKSRKPKKA